MNAPEHAIPIPGAAAVGSLPIDAICKSPSNPRRRIDDACLRELADSIASHGLIGGARRGLIAARPFARRVVRQR